MLIQKVLFCCCSSGCGGCFVLKSRVWLGCILRRDCPLVATLRNSNPAASGSYSRKPGVHGPPIKSRWNGALGLPWRELGAACLSWGGLIWEKHSEAGRAFTPMLLRDFPLKKTQVCTGFHFFFLIYNLMARNLKKAHYAVKVDRLNICTFQSVPHTIAILKLWSFTLGFTPSVPITSMHLIPSLNEEIDFFCPSASLMLQNIYFANASDPCDLTGTHLPNGTMLT